jgi:hypothetical protein
MPSNVLDVLVVTYIVLSCQGFKPSRFAVKTNRFPFLIYHHCHDECSFQTHLFQIPALSISFQRNELESTQRSVLVLYLN